MAKSTDMENAVNRLSSEIQNIMMELFGECADNDGILRAHVKNLGVTDSSAIIEVLLEGGLREEVPYGILHFHTTIAENIPEESLADLLISINGLNHVINAGAFPGFGAFAYYDPLSQVYLSYRMPVNLENIDTEFDNIRYYMATLYEQIDLFADFIMFAIVNPGGMSISDYMDYLDEVSDLDNIEERISAFEEEFNAAAAAMGSESDET